nr:type II toxin-antitoxin system RelE/ParE family toxin [Escherichia coli]
MFSVVYHPEAREEATALPVKIRVKFDRLIGKLEYDARLLREPDTKPLGDGLFEIRTMGTDIARGNLGIPQRQYHHHAPCFHQEVTENASERNRSRQKAVSGGT